MAQRMIDIKKELDSTALTDLEEAVKKYQMDERKGVQKLLDQAKRRLQALGREKERLKAMRVFEDKYCAYERICGIDEAGRGPLAGPVAAGAVILPKDAEILYLNDSKKLSEAKRELLYEEIKEKALGWAVAMVSPQVIDEINILQATYQAMRQAIEKLSPPPGLLLNDAVTIPQVSLKQVGIIKGDAKSVSIAAASIMAKVTRDRMMREYHKLYPQYGFDRNKGYGSKEHMEALRIYGPCPIHRRSFIKNLAGKEMQNSFEECQGTKNPFEAQEEGGEPLLPITRAGFGRE